MVENELINLKDLKAITKDFIDNNGDGSCSYCQGSQSKNASDNPKKAVVSLQTGKQTTYNQFIAVQDELSKAYYELRDSYCVNMLKKASNNLTETDVKQLTEAYPFILSEDEIK